MEKHDQNLFLIKENSKRQKQTLKPKILKILPKKPSHSHKIKKIIHINDEKPHSEFIFENCSIEFEKTDKISKFFDLKTKYTNTKRTFLN